MHTSAADIFLYVASACAVILLVIACAVGYVLVRLLLAVQLLLGIIQAEVEGLVETKRRAGRIAAFSVRWLRFVGRKIIGEL